MTAPLAVTALGAALLVGASYGLADTVTLSSDQVAYGPGSHTSDSVPAGTPTAVRARITSVVDVGSAIPGSGDVMGLSGLADGTVVALTRATSAGPSGAGHLVRVDPDSGSGPAHIEPIRSVEVDQEYLWLQQQQPQIAAGWTLGPVPGLSPTALAIGTGSRFGVLDEYTPGESGSGKYTGVVTDQQGSPTGPVTGTCSDDPGSTNPVTWTTSGSEVIERRTYPTSAGNGHAPRVRMLASPMMELTPAQQELVRMPGSEALPLLTPADSLLVGGLRSLTCLSDAQVLGMREATGLQDSVLRGATDAVPVTSSALVAVVDRELADSWYERGSRPAEGIAARPGEHYSGGLVGRATAAGPDRLDAVVIDSVSGTAVAGIHLSGPQVPDDAQVTALMFDAGGRSGLAAVAGSQKLLRFEL